VVSSGREDLVDDVATLVSELVSNAVIHARTQMMLTVESVGAGVRVALADDSAVMPRFAGADRRSISGRGLLIIDRLASRWGVDRLPQGKVVWVEIETPSAAGDTLEDDDLVTLWVDDAEGIDDPPSDSAVSVRVEIDVEALVESRHETDSLIRDMQLLGLDSEPEALPTKDETKVTALGRQLARALDEFADARRQIQTQALAAQRAGAERTVLELHLEPDAAPAARRFLEATEAADNLTASGVLLVPASSQATRDIRRYYVETIIKQLRR